MNKVLVKAQPTELVFSPSQLWLCLRETRSAPSVPLAGEQLVPSFFCCLFGNQKEQFSERKLIVYALIIAVCGGISPGAVQGEEKQVPASGSKPFGTFCKGKSRQTVALLVRAGWGKPCCNTPQQCNLEEALQGKSFQNISARNRYSRGPLGFSKPLEQLQRCFTPAYWKFLSFSAASELVNLSDHLSVTYPQKPRAKRERDGPRNLP